jgi:tetratricopeptide (TPR) repeat protein
MIRFRQPTEIELRVSNSEFRSDRRRGGRPVFGVRCSISEVALVLGLLALLAAGTLKAAAASASDTPAGFDSANRLYEQGKFGEAASAYRKLLESGQVSAALYFNLGNACFKSGEIGRAIAAYREAERIDPRDPDLRANLQFVRNQIQGPTLPPGRWQRWLNRLTVNEWTIVACAGFWLWLLLLIAVQLRPALKQMVRGLIFLGGLSTLLLMGCAGAALSVTSSRSAIVIAHEAEVRNGPLDESPGSFTAHDGAELTVLDHKNNWLQVTAGDRRVGWVKSDQVLVLPRS